MRPRGLSATLNTRFFMRWIIDARTLCAHEVGGVSRVATHLCDALRDVTTDARISFATTGRSEQELTVRNVERVHLRIPNKLWSAGSISRATSLTRAVEKRVGPSSAAFFPNIGFMGEIHIPYTLLLHDLSFLIEPRWFSRRMRIWHRAVRATELIQNAAHLFAVSETTRQDAIRLLSIPEDRITTIPLGPTLTYPPPRRVNQNESESDFPRRGLNPQVHGGVFQQKNGVLGEGVGREQKTSSEPAYFLPYVMTMGHGNARKNTELAIECVRRLRTRPEWSDLHLVILGSRPHAPEPWIIHEERVDHDRLASLYAGARALLYPSWYEGFGLPLHEAASFGTPQLASSTGALPETAPQRTVLLNPMRLHHWVDALDHALQQPRPEPVFLDPKNWTRTAEIIRDILVRISLQVD